MITEARFAIGEPLNERDATFPRPESRSSTSVALVSAGFVHAVRSTTPCSIPGGRASSVDRRSETRVRPRSAIVPRTKFPPDPDDVIVKDWRFFRRNGAIWTDPVHTPAHLRDQIWRPDLDAEAARYVEARTSHDRQDEAERNAQVVHERRIVANSQLRRRTNSRCQLQWQSGQSAISTEMYDRAIADDHIPAEIYDEHKNMRPSSATVARHNIKGWRYFGGSRDKNVWDIPERQAPHRIRGVVDLERNRYAIRNIEGKAKDEFTKEIDRQRLRRERHDRILLRFRNQQLQNYEQERSVSRDFQRQLVAETNITNSEYNPQPDDEETLRREKSYDNIAQGIARVNCRRQHHQQQQKQQQDDGGHDSRVHDAHAPPPPPRRQNSMTTGSTDDAACGKKTRRKRTKVKRTRIRCSQRVKQLAKPRIRSNHPERLHLDHSDFAGLLVAVNPNSSHQNKSLEVASRSPLPRSSLAAYATGVAIPGYLSRDTHTHVYVEASSTSSPTRSRPTSALLLRSSQKKARFSTGNVQRLRAPSRVHSVVGPLSSRRPANERWLSRKHAHIRGNSRSNAGVGVGVGVGAETARTHEQQERQKCMREIQAMEARVREREAARTFSEETREFLLRKSVNLLTHRTSLASEGSDNDSEKENQTEECDKK